LRKTKGAKGRAKASSNDSIGIRQQPSPHIRERLTLENATPPFGFPSLQSSFCEISPLRSRGVSSGCTFVAVFCRTYDGPVSLAGGGNCFEKLTSLSLFSPCGPSGCDGGNAYKHRPTASRTSRLQRGVVPFPKRHRSGPTGQLNTKPSSHGFPPGNESLDRLDMIHRFPRQSPQPAIAI
jgi:hypothetical protein